MAALSSCAYLKGKLALVTGASGGIGAAICSRLAAQGARLVLQYHSNDETIRSLLDQPEFQNEAHTSFCADLSDASQVKELVDFSASQQENQSQQQQQPSLDLLINTAGTAHKSHSPLDPSVTYEQWQESWRDTLAVNLVGAANLSYCAVPFLVRGTGKRIIHVSSRGAFRGEPEYPAYGASKAGLNALSQSLAVALAPVGISVFAIAPGFVDTAMAQPFLDESLDQRRAIEQQSPMNRIATPDDVAFWAEVLSNPRASFATGTIIDVNGASYLRS